MSNDINLVSSDSNNLSKAEKNLRKFRVIATSIVIGVGFVSLLLFLLNRVFSPQSIISQQDTVRTNIEALQTKQAKLLVLTQKLNDISVILKNRENYDIILNSITSQSPTDVSLSSLSIDKKKVSLIATSPSLLSINGFIDMLKGMVDKKQFIKNITINNLSLNGKYGYFLTLEMQLL